jgi:hypothetical protein
MLRGRGEGDDQRRARVIDQATQGVASFLGMNLPGWGRATLGPAREDHD